MGSSGPQATRPLGLGHREKGGTQVREAHGPHPLALPLCPGASAHSPSGGGEDESSFSHLASCPEQSLCVLFLLPLFFSFQKPFSDLYRMALAPCHLGQETRGGVSETISPFWFYWGEQGKATERASLVRDSLGVRADFCAFWSLVLSSLSLVSPFFCSGV